LLCLLRSTAVADLSEAWERIGGSRSPFTAPFNTPSVGKLLYDAEDVLQALTAEQQLPASASIGTIAQAVSVCGENHVLLACVLASLPHCSSSSRHSSSRQAQQQQQQQLEQLRITATDESEKVNIPTRAPTASPKCFMVTPGLAAPSATAHNVVAALAAGSNSSAKQQ
jgi:hypothetical protein